MTVSLLDLTTRASEKADMENSSFISSTQALYDINASAQALYDLLVAKYEDYFAKDPAYQFTLSGTNKTSVPSDFYKVRGVDLSLGGKWLPLEVFNFAERFLIDDTVPVDGTYRLWYIPQFTKLANNTDTIPVQMEPWDEFIPIDCAIKWLSKEESDVSSLQAQRSEIVNRIEALASNRQSGPERIAETSGRHSIRFVYRLMGTNLIIYRHSCVVGLIERLGYY